MDNAGGGWSFGERGIALTRWREDSVRNDYGTHIFVRDLDTNHLWSVAYQPTRVEADTYEVIFNPDKVEFKRRDFGIALHTEITVSPEDNVEVRRVTIKNLTNRPKNIELTSYGEVVLGDWRADATHPAFAKMFVESEWVGDLEMLMFSRRPRSAREEKLFMFYKLSMPVCWDRTQYETSRSTFLGRANTVHEPQVFKTRSALSGSTGAVLDPVFSLRTRLQIEPGGSEQASFITAMATSREEAMHLAQRYNESHAVVRAFEMAWSQCNVELRNEQIGTSQTHLFQKIANAIFFNVRTLRGEAEAIGRNRLTQSALWRFGISGDRPIVYVSVNDPGQIKTVQELLMCH